MAEKTTPTARAHATQPGKPEALARVSGISWASWVAHFESHGAARLTHPEIARIARDFMPSHVKNPDWWAQGAAVAFEQHAGLRVPGQTAAGTFRVSASATIIGDRDTVLAAWVALVGDRSEHLGFTTANERQSRTEKRSFWRVNLTGAGTVEAAASEKTNDKSVLTLSHQGLATESDIEVWRKHWKKLLASL